MSYLYGIRWHIPENDLVLALRQVNLSPPPHDLYHMTLTVFLCFVRNSTPRTSTKSTGPQSGTQ